MDLWNDTERNLVELNTELSVAVTLPASVIW